MGIGGGGGGESGEGGGGDGGGGEGGGGEGLGGGGPGVLAAMSTGSHCGGTATGWLACASLLATLNLVV